MGFSPLKQSIGIKQKKGKPNIIGMKNANSFWICHTPTPTSLDSFPDVAAVSDDDSSVDSFFHFEMPKAEGRFGLITQK